MQTAIQLYTLRFLEEPLSRTLERVANTTLDGVEFAGFGDETPSALATQLDDLDLGVAGAHVSLSDLEESYEETAAAYDALGCEHIVVPSYPREEFETAEGVDEAARRLSTVAGRLETDGFSCHYHNHHFEFDTIDGETAFDRFAARADESVQFQIDTGLTRCADVDPVALIDRYGDRISLVHLTDTDPDSSDSLHAELGDGIVDLEACVDAARRNDVEWLIGEHGGATEPLSTLERFDDELHRLRGGDHGDGRSA